MHNTSKHENFLLKWQISSRTSACSNTTTSAFDVNGSSRNVFKIKNLFTKKIDSIFPMTFQNTPKKKVLLLYVEQEGCDEVRIFEEVYRLENADTQNTSDQTKGKAFAL